MTLTGGPQLLFGSLGVSVYSEHIANYWKGKQFWFWIFGLKKILQMITVASIIMTCTYYGDISESFLRVPRSVSCHTRKSVEVLLFLFWWSMSRDDFFWLCKSTSPSATHLILPLATTWYISYYHRYLCCHPVAVCYDNYVHIARWLNIDSWPLTIHI